MPKSHRCLRQVLYVGLVTALGVMAATRGGASAHAEDFNEAADFSVERYRMTADRRGILTTEWPVLAAVRQWEFNAWLGYANDPLVLYTMDDGVSRRTGALITGRVGGELGAAFVVAPRLQLHAAWAMVAATQRESATPGVNGELRSLGGGLGDLRLGGKFEFVRAPLGLALVADVTLPTATGKDYRDERTITFAPAFAAGYQTGPLRVALNVGYLLRGRTTLADLTVDDEFFVRGGLALDVLQRKVSLQLGAQVATATAKFFNAVATNPAELLFGANAQLGAMAQLFAHGSLGVNQGFGTPDWRTVVGLRFTGQATSAERELANRTHASPRSPHAESDRDLDGIADAQDAAPDDPEDRDGYQDHDGAPELDNDADGIPDAADRCPIEAENVNGNADSDGCPDAGDDDHDGVFDDKDRCKDQAEDADGFADDDGCPDLDNDNDGVIDAKDACREVVGPVENQGCPDQDIDGDAIVDRLDNCPKEAGVPAHHGCNGKQLVEIRGDMLVITSPVFFKTNSNVILGKSHNVLNNVAAVMTAQSRIKRVRVEGHTDSQGDDAKNLTLSQRRAEAVVKYLVGKGVDAGRLTAKGFGEMTPIADNGTGRGRAQNRRVEFKIEELQ